MAKFLIKHGANVDAQAKHGLTSLHQACDKHEFKVIKFLVNNGANISATEDYYGMTPIEIELMRSYPCLEIIKFPVENGGDINTKRKDDRFTPLHSVHDLELTKFLVDNGADIHEENDKGETPLHYACYWGRLEKTELLIMSGAALHAKDKREGH